MEQLSALCALRALCAGVLRALCALVLNLRCAASIKARVEFWTSESTIAKDEEGALPQRGRQ